MVLKLDLGLILPNVIIRVPEVKNVKIDAKEADIAFVFLSPHSLGAAQYREKIEKMLERNFSEYHFDLEYEEI